jgi:hypothetical protein
MNPEKPKEEKDNRQRNSGEKDRYEHFDQVVHGKAV